MRREGVSEKEQLDSYLVQTTMKNKKGCALLVDPGAHDDLCSDGWRDAMVAEMPKEYNTQVSRLEQPFNVGGVGKGTQQVVNQLAVPVGIQGEVELFQAPMIENSRVPALLGNKSLKGRRSLLDTFQGILYTVGPGGYELRLSPGSRQMSLEESHGGHWMLPCTEYPNKQYNVFDSNRLPTTRIGTSRTRGSSTPARGGDYHRGGWDAGNSHLGDSPGGGLPPNPGSAARCSSDAAP